MKWFLMLYLFGLTGCATVVNSIPSNDNTEQNSLDSPPMVFDDAINKAFLANVAGFWINSVIVVYKMSDDGYFFYTNSSGSDGSFTLKTNYSFYGALEDQKGIFIVDDTKPPNNSLKYTGIRLYKGQLAIEDREYTNPRDANSSSRYYLYGRK